MSIASSEGDVSSHAAMQASLELFSLPCAAVYGDVEGGLMTVGLEGEHDSPYAETKILGEEIAKEIATESTKITCLRFFNVYGPGQQHFRPLCICNSNIHR